MPAVYGTVRGVEQDEGAQRGSWTLRARVAFSLLVGVVAFCAIFAWGNNTSSVDVTTTEDYNKIREDNAQIPGVAETCKKVMKTKEGETEYRFAIFGFNSDTESRKGKFTHDPKKDFFVPLIEYPATSNWNADWNLFKSVLPKDDVAVGVFRFPIWNHKDLEDETAIDSFESVNIIVTWSPENVSPRELRRGGFFLPRILVACEEQLGESFGATQHIALTTTDDDNDYYKVCETLAEDPSTCVLEREFRDCPFDEDLPSSPCTEKVCEGADFTDAPEAISKPCCDYIQHQYCPFHQDAPGCQDMAYDMVGKICKQYDEDPMINEDNIEIMEFNDCGPVIGSGGIMVRYHSNSMCKCVFENDHCFDHNQCKRDRSCVFPGVTTYKGCNPEFCRSPCTQFKVATDSSAHCSGCPKLKEGYKCYPGAVGFKEFECCGSNDMCNSLAVKNDEAKCTEFGSMGCGWGNSQFCRELIDKQTRLSEVTKILAENSFDECQFGIDDWNNDGTPGTCEDLAEFKTARSSTELRDFVDGDRCACCSACMGAEEYCTTECNIVAEAE